MFPQHGHIEVSVVIPVFNDRDALEKAIPESIDALKSITEYFELIIAEDGSSDGSTEVAKKWGTINSNIHLSHSTQRLGKGEAISRAFRISRGSIVCFYDVDLATDMIHLSQIIDDIRQGYHISIGSRLITGNNVDRTINRSISSKGYNFLVRTILKSSIFDHQCGFKAFNRDRLLALLPFVQTQSWFWDTEVLVRAQRAGYRIHERPVKWHSNEKSNVKMKDTFSLGTNIIRLWWQLHLIGS